MARARLHLPLGAEDARSLRGLRRRAAVRRARRPGRRSEGVPVRRGAQGRAQALGVQGVRHRLHPGDADRHLHGLARGRLRRVLQLRAHEPAPRRRSGADPAMTGRGTNWVDEALREHEEHTAAEQAAARDAGAGDAGAGDAGAGGRAATASDREQQVLDRIDRARRRRPRIREERITMSHGAGGKASRTLVEAVFLDAFRNPLLEPLEDAAQLQVGGSRLALTTDTYVVSPLFFPGGNIGDLAVNGTVNDLAVSGATPLYLSAGFVLEEGFP